MSRVRRMQTDEETLVQTARWAANSSGSVKAVSHRFLCFGVELVLLGAPAECCFLNILFKTNPIHLLEILFFLQLLMMELPLHKGFFFHLRKFVWIGNKHKVLELDCRISTTPVSLILLYSVWPTRLLSPITCFLLNTLGHVSTF